MVPFIVTITAFRGSKLRSGQASVESEVTITAFRGFKLSSRLALVVSKFAVIIIWGNST